MPVDPNTGLYSTQVSYQPTGAMGAVTELLNAQKAQEIAQTLQQQREAQAQLEQSQAQQYDLAAQRAQQGREATMAAVNNAPQGKDLDMNAVARANIGATGDVKEFMPYARSLASAKGKVDSARVTALGRIATAGLPQGATPAQTSQYLRQFTEDPEEIAAAIDEMRNGPGANTSLPVPGAKAGELESRGNLEDVKSSDIAATQTSRIAVNEAKAQMMKEIGWLKSAQAAVAGKDKLSRGETAAVLNHITQIDKIIEKKTGRNKYGMKAKLDPDEQATVTKLQQERDLLWSQVQAKSDVAQPAPAGAPKVGNPSPSPFGDVVTGGASTGAIAPGPGNSLGLSGIPKP
jgi:hypothetical protein